MSKSTPDSIIQDLRNSPLDGRIRSTRSSVGLIIVELDLEQLIPGIQESLAVVIGTSANQPLRTLDRTQLERTLIQDAHLGTQDLALIVIDDDNQQPIAIRNRWIAMSLRDFRAAITAVDVAGIGQVIARSFQPRVLNPYQSDRVVAPAMFFGRREEVEDLCESNKSYVVFGARRVGKSSFANRVRRELLAYESYRHSIGRGQSMKSWTSVCSIDMHNLPTVDDVWRKILEAMGFTIQDLMPGAKFRISLEDKKTYVLKSETEILQRILATTTRSLILLDEVDHAIREDRLNGYKVFSQLQGLVDDKSCNLRVVLFGYEELLKAWESHDFPLNRTRLHQKPLGPLAPEDVGTLMQVPMDRVAVAIDSFDEVRDQVHSATGGMPNLVQDICSVLLELESVNRNRRVTLFDLATALKDPFFLSRVDAQFEQVEEPLPRLIAYLMTKPHEFRLDDVLNAIRPFGLPVDDRDVRQSLAQLNLYSIVAKVGAGDEYVFASNVLQHRLHQQVSHDVKGARIAMLRTKIAATHRATT